MRQPQPTARPSRSIDEVAADLIAAHRRRRREPDWRLPSGELGRQVAALLGLPSESPLVAAIPESAPVAPASPARQAPSRRHPPAPTAGGPPHSGDVYGSVRGVFDRNEQWLRQQASVMDRIVERMRVDPASGETRVGPLQRELRIALAPGGAGRGYFALRNGPDRAREIVLEVARHRGLPPGVTRPPAVTLDPARVRLGPGEVGEFAVHVDLADCPLGPHDEIEIGLRAQGEDAVVAFIWVVLLVEETDADA